MGHAVNPLTEMDLAKAYARSLQAMLADTPGPWADQLRACLETAELTPTGIAARQDHPGLHYLEALMDELPDDGLGGVARLLVDRLRWYQIFEGGGIEESLAQGLLAGQVIGRSGIVDGDGLYAGMFLLAPGLHYPLHQHPALEVYAVVAGEVTIHHGRRGPGRVVSAGECSITPPHQVHSLTTGASPCLIGYLWTGDLTGENWWWQQDDEGQWWRLCWSRQPQGHWAPDRREPLTEAEAERAGDPA